MTLTQGGYLLCVVAVVVVVVAAVVVAVVVVVAAAANSAVQTGEVEGKQIKSIYYDKHRKHTVAHTVKYSHSDTHTLIRRQLPANCETDTEAHDAFRVAKFESNVGSRRTTKI